MFHVDLVFFDLYCSRLYTLFSNPEDWVVRERALGLWKHESCADWKKSI